jgi:amino acid permease
MVCRLSYKIAISYSRSNGIALKNLFHQITYLAVWERANNSTSVLDIVTIFYLIKRQSISPLNSLNKYPSVLYLVTGSSAKAVLSIQTTTN